jgi:hypothetical protein
MVARDEVLGSLIVGDFPIADQALESGLREEIALDETDACITQDGQHFSFF